MEKYHQQLATFFAQNSNKTLSAQMSTYLKNLFPFFGLQKPQRSPFFKQLIATIQADKVDLIAAARYFWEFEEREYHYFALACLEKHKNNFVDTDVQILEQFICSHSWWDSVDFIAPTLLGRYFQLYPAQIAPVTSAWVKSDNFWLQRAAILFQLNYKDKTDTKLLFDYCLLLADSKEFFVQKAMGWALRNLYRHSPELVAEFVKNNQLPNLTRREALKHAPKG